MFTPRITTLLTLAALALLLGVAQAQFGQGDGSDLGPDDSSNYQPYTGGSGSVGRTITMAQIMGRDRPYWQGVLQRITDHTGSLAQRYWDIRRNLEQTRDAGQRQRLMAELNQAQREWAQFEAKRKNATFIVQNWNKKTTVYYYSGADAGRFPLATNLEQVLNHLRGNLGLVGTTVYFRSGW